MDSNSKLLKPVEEGEADLISNLPSSLIRHIISFLPTKIVVQTTVLSTKWKHLWTYVPNLDFDDWRDNYWSDEVCFIDLVDRVLTLHVSDLQKFHMKCHETYDDSHLHSWIVAALSPFYLYYSGITRTGWFFFLRNVPTLVRLHNLKILCLDSIEFSDDESVKRLFSSCPLLEDLSIKGCLWGEITVFNIFAPALKRLIIYCETGEELTIDCKYKVVLNTPNLQHFDYDDYVAVDYSLNNLNSIVNAKINLLSCIPETSSPVRDQSLLELSIAKFVEGISKVQRLYLSGSSVLTFGLRRYPLPKFPHLIYLDLEDRWIGWQMLLDFLESSPQLETLIFAGLLQDLGTENQTCRWYAPVNVPSCLLFHLKVIRIGRFHGRRDGMQMAKYFLKNSRVLREFVTYASNEDSREFRCRRYLPSPQLQRHLVTKGISYCDLLRDDEVFQTCYSFSSEFR
ncbi:F-box/LRR-repeat protein At4g14103-like [Cornus florida]|uniref:F-box/LRR-repeat protein At4g14103-like n=1 Tax=Cornus florida TaxID=4283 RepID=UPI002897AEAA|nr:F-box/LRR-repeat protein At4g14103-like [Cornus florida]